MLHVKNISTGEITKVASLRVVNNLICAYYDFVAGAALFLGTEKECFDAAWSMYQADRNVADTLEVREY